MCFCKCVCVLKLSHPAVILKVSSAFSSLPGELFSSVLPSLRWVTWVVTLPVYGRPSAAPWPSQHRPRQWWQEALGWGVCFLPPALATCCQARAVGCFSSSVIRGDHPPPHRRCAVHVTRSSTWKGGFTDSAACQRPCCRLPEQSSSCLPGKEWPLASSF